VRNVIYAGTEWEVIYEGELILHLRSLKDRKLIIHCSSKSEFLREEIKIETTDNSGVAETRESLPKGI